MHIRTTTPADCHGVSAILEASYSQLMPVGYEPSVLNATLPIMTKANPALLSSGTYFIALTDCGAHAGCGGWTQVRPGTGEVTSGLGHIRHFATHPDHVGKGTGRAIYAACEAQATSSGIERFECYASLNAEGFYKSLGFAIVEAVDVPMGQGRVFPSLRMTRDV